MAELKADVRSVYNLCPGRSSSGPVRELWRAVARGMAHATEFSQGLVLAGKETALSPS